MNGISIIIPYYNDLRIKDCLKTLSTEFENLKRLSKKKIEIIIINDGSKKLKIRSKILPIRLINKKINEGVGKARNIGLKYSKKKYVLFLDSDVIIPKNFLNQILRIIKNKSKKIFYFPQSHIPADKNPSLFQKYLSISWHLNQTKDFQSKEMLTSFCLLVEKNYLIKIGAFSEKYKKAGGEEFELLSRINKKFIKVCEKINPFHFQDSFIIRIKKLFYRSKNFKNVIVENKQIPTKTKFFYSFKLLSSLLLICSFIYFIFFKKYLFLIFIFLFIHIMNEHNFFSFLIKLKKVRLLFVSLIFKLIENIIIAIGLIISYISINV